MDQKKLISIIVPTYNSGRYIANCISSILSQSYENYEIIIVDNNSDDNTIKLINSFKSDKIIIYKVINNGNISISRNLGIKNSKGSWIAFLDSDDSWEKDKLQIISKKFLDYDLIFHNMKIIKNNKIQNTNFFIKDISNNSFDMVENLSRKGNPILNSSVVVKKSLLDEVGMISENQPSFINDYHTWLKISLISNKFFYEKKILGTYSIHNQNYSLNIRNSYYYLKCVNQFKQYYSNKVKKKIFGYFNYEKGKELLKKGNFRNGLKCFCKSILFSDLEIKYKSFLQIILYPFKKF